MMCAMKKLVVLSILVSAFIFPVFAQENQNDQSKPKTLDRYYVKTAYIDDMRKHSKGYVVYYIRQDGQRRRAFIPYTWFEGNTTGSIYFVNGPANPTMSVFYKNGEIVRIDITLNKDGQLPAYGAPVGERYWDNDFPSKDKKEKKQFVF